MFEAEDDFRYYLEKISTGGHKSLALEMTHSAIILGTLLVFSGSDPKTPKNDEISYSLANSVVKKRSRHP